MMAKKKSKRSWNPKNNFSREKLDELAEKSRRSNPEDPLFDENFIKNHQ